MRDEAEPRGLARVVRWLGAPVDAAELARLPVGERLVVAGTLAVLSRLHAVAGTLDALVEDQRRSVRRGREILEMLPPLLGKMSDLLDLEIAAARGRLRATGHTGGPQTPATGDPHDGDPLGPRRT